MRRLFKYQTNVVSLSAKGDLSVKYGEWVLRTILGCISDFSKKAWELKEKWGRVREWNSSMLMRERVLLIELFNRGASQHTLHSRHYCWPFHGPSCVAGHFTIGIMGVQLCSLVAKNCPPRQGKCIRSKMTNHVFWFKWRLEHGVIWSDWQFSVGKSHSIKCTAVSIHGWLYRKLYQILLVQRYYPTSRSKQNCKNNDSFQTSFKLLLGLYDLGNVSLFTKLIQDQVHEFTEIIAPLVANHWNFETVMTLRSLIYWITWLWQFDSHSKSLVWYKLFAKVTKLHKAYFESAHNKCMDLLFFCLFK